MQLEISYEMQWISVSETEPQSEQNISHVHYWGIR